MQLQCEKGDEKERVLWVREKVRDIELLKSHHYRPFDKTDKAHKEFLSPRFPLPPSRWYLNVHAADLSSFRSLTVNLPPSLPLHSSLPPFSLRPLLVDAINYATAACAQLRRCCSRTIFSILSRCRTGGPRSRKSTPNRIREEIRAGLTRWMS